MTTTNRTILESLDRHRSPSATEIYSTARTYLKNTNEINQSNSEIINTENEGEKIESPRVQSEDPEAHKVERRKKQKQRISGHRKRTSSSETPIERIPQPLGTERSRSVEMIHGIERVEFERSKTENILSSSDTSVLESSSSSLNQMQSTKLMTLSLGRGQTLSSGSRLDSGRRSRSNSKEFLDFTSEGASGKPSDAISSVRSNEASIQEYIGQTFPLVKNIDSNQFAASSTTTTSSLERRHPTSQPLPSQVASITRSNFHSYSQPPLSNTSGMMITDDTLSSSSVHFTPSSGKKNRSSTMNSQKRQQNNLNGVALASLESTPSHGYHGKGGKDFESTSKAVAQPNNANFVTPPRGKGIDLSSASQSLFTSPGPNNSSNTSSSSTHIFLKDKPAHNHNRVIEKISLSSGSNHPSRSNSPMTKREFEDNEMKPKAVLLMQSDEVQISGTETRSSLEDKSIAIDENRAEANDRLVREKLQEVKAMNRQDSSNGAVMYRFSLWKGVQRKDPIPDISLPRKVFESEATQPNPNETPTRPPRFETSENSSQKKSSRRRGPRAIIEAQDDVSSANASNTLSTIPTRKDQTMMSQRSHSHPNTTQIHPEISRRSPFALRKGSLQGKESLDEQEEEEKYSDSDDVSEEQQSSSGRAYAFRSMVGSCKASNLSCGSIAESIQTEMGVPKFYLNTSNTVESVESLSSDEDEGEDADQEGEEEGEEEFSLANFDYVEDEDAAILGIALEHDISFASDHDQDDLETDVDQSSATQYSHSFGQQQQRQQHQRQQREQPAATGFHPKFSLELSLEAISQPTAVGANGPPLIKKRDQARAMVLDDDDQNATTSTAEPSGSILVSASLPQFPTTKSLNEHPPSSQPIRRKSASSGHTKRIREMTSAAKVEATQQQVVVIVDEVTNDGPPGGDRDPLQESRRTDNSSPSLLSEASEYDTFENESHLEDKNYQNPITSTTDDMQRVQPTNHQQHQQQQQQQSQYPNVNIGSFNSSSSKKQSLHNDEMYAIHDFEWKKGNEILGEGSFGQVFKGMNCSTGELLAVKQICLTDGTEEEVATLRQEIDLMDSLKHPNIVRYVGTSISSRYLYIVLEYVPGGSVAGMLSQFGAFSEVLIRRLVSQIMQGVDYLHQKGIIHRDIKGANVLVTDAGVAKLADFGCSKQLAGLCTTSLEESMRTIRGSVPWMAPEVIKQTGHGRSADIWSIGATMIEMATAKPPWQEFSNNLAALFHVATSEHPPPIPSGLSQECVDFIGRCMKIDPKERATSKDLLMDPFLLALIVTTKTTTATATTEG